MIWSLIRCKVLSLLLLCSFSFFFSNSFASTIAQIKYLASGTYANSPTSLCTGKGYTYANENFKQTVYSAPSWDGASYYKAIPIGFTFGFCTNTYGGTTGLQFYQVQVCPYPGSYVNTGSSMQCGTGPLEETCPSSGTTGSGQLTLSGLDGQLSVSSSNLCADSGGNSCGISCNDGIASYNSDTGKSSISCFGYTYTGAGCSATTGNLAGQFSGNVTNAGVTPNVNPPQKASDCPGGTGFAEINNKTMCLPSGSSYTGGSATTTTATGSTTTTATTVINNNGTSTTTYTTITKDTGGNVTGTTTTTLDGSMNQFDAFGLPNGVGTGSGSGTGTQNPLDLGTAPTFDETLPGEAVFTTKTQANPVISTSIFQVSASCPAPIVFTAFNQEFSISFQAVCDLAPIIRGIILMLSAIVAIRAVVTS